MKTDRAGWRSWATRMALVGVALASGPAMAALLHADGFEVADPALLDERRIRSMMASTPPTAAQVAALLATVGKRGGFPVATEASTFLFVAQCEDQPWSLEGDFNGWVPASMHHHGAMCWAEQAMPTALEQGYLFVRPDATRLADPAARRYVYVGDQELSLVRTLGQRIERGFAFGPQVGLLPREVRVLVPANDDYDRALYMPDGQDLFDPQAMFGGWALQSRAPDNLLVVGVDRTDARIDEYTHTPDDLGAGNAFGGDGDRYADLVHLWIRPWVERRYPTVTRHGVLGSSLGGLISLHIADRYPNTYSFAGSMSGSLGWGRIGTLGNQTLIERYATGGRRAAMLYLDSGGTSTGCVDADGDGIRDDAANSDNFCVTQQMRDTLIDSGHVPGIDLIYLHDAGALGNPGAWGARAHIPLGLFAEP